MIEKEGLFVCYLRLRYNAVVSLIALTSSNPMFIAFVSSCMLWVTNEVHSSVWFSHKADSMFMYIIVDSILLCPKTVLTWIMSLVLWYSIVPLKCLNVWKWMFFSLGLFSLVAVLFRSDSNVVLSACLFVWKILSLVLGKLFSMAMSLSLAGNILLLLPFSAVM